jgi:hypothetical protein
MEGLACGCMDGVVGVLKWRPEVAVLKWRVSLKWRGCSKWRADPRIGLWMS